MSVYMPADQKQALLRGFAGTHRVLFETGTADGDTTAALADDFDRVITVEIDDKRYLICAEKFLFDPKVSLIHGESSYVIEMIVPSLRQPTLFWLDAHRSGGEEVELPFETPVQHELWHIMNSATVTGLDHLIVVDDARLFGMARGYPTPLILMELAAQFNYEVESNRDVFIFRRRT